MNKSSVGKFKVSQTLHGYRDGHKLLASSFVIDEYAGIEMARMSDLMPQHLNDGSSYICGYPLKSINKYVLSKTWSAYEMPRPGCVWTHSILLDYATVAKIQNIFPLLNFFERPKTSKNFIYDEDLIVDLEWTSEFKYIDDSFVQEMQEMATNVLQGIYSEKESRILIPANFESEINNAIAILSWNQMPPRLRRDFVFCTAGGLRSFTPPAEVTLIFTDELIPQPAVYSSDSLDSSGLGFLLQDFFTFKQSELRTFISRYDVDAKNARNAVPKLAMIAEKLFINDLRLGLELSSELIVELFPSNSDCRMLKREFLGGSIISSKNMDQGKIFEAVVENVLPSLKFLEDFEDFDSINNFINRLISLNADLAKVIKSCLGGVRGSLGYCLLKELCENIPVDLIASVRLDAEVKLTLASLNKDLLYNSSFWATFDSQISAEDLNVLNSMGDLDVLAEGFLTGRMYAPFRALMRENASIVLPHLITFIEKQNASVRHFLVSEYRDERVQMIDYLSISNEHRVSVLATIAEDILYSTYPQVPALLWLDLFYKNKYATNYLTPALAYVIFEQANWVNDRSIAVELYKLSFPVLHNLSDSNAGAQSVLEKIRGTYPSDYNSHASDVGSRLRRKLCAFFEAGRQYSDFIQCAGDDKTLSKLFTSMCSLWRGSDWLKGLLDAADSGEFHLTANQKIMLLGVLPKPRKVFFGFW